MSKIKLNVAEKDKVLQWINCQTYDKIHHETDGLGECDFLIAEELLEHLPKFIETVLNIVIKDRKLLVGVS